MANENDDGGEEHGDTQGNLSSIGYFLECIFRKMTNENDGGGEEQGDTHRDQHDDECLGGVVLLAIAM